MSSVSEHSEERSEHASEATPGGTGHRHHHHPFCSHTTTAALAGPNAVTLRLFSILLERKITIFILQANKDLCLPTGGVAAGRRELKSTATDEPFVAVLQAKSFKPLLNSQKQSKKVDKALDFPLTRCKLLFGSGLRERTP